MSNYKKQRREAEAKSVGVPYAAHTENARGSLELHPICTKAIYKRLKRAEQERRRAQ